MNKVLVVDDSAFIRRILIDILRSLGIQDIDQASDGFEAVHMTRTNSYDIIFMDLLMPKVDGLEAIKEIVPFHPDVKIIVCTSVGQDKVTEEALSAGAKEYIQKPFKKDSIKAVLDRQMRAMAN